MATCAFSSLISLDIAGVTSGTLNNSLSSADMELMKPWTSVESDHLRVMTVIGEGFAR